MIKLLRYNPHTDNAHIPKNMIWIIGNFDGVHLGHQSVIQLAHHNNPHHAPIGLLTFEPHPRRIFKPDSPTFRIMSFGQKLQILNQYGVNYCYAYKFSKDLAEMSGDAFCQKILSQHLSASKIIVGYDFCFGKNRSGTTDSLIKSGEQYGFETIIAPPAVHHHTRYSSSKLREYITSGNMDMVKEFLGRDYILSGHVSQGRQMARTIGYPTANIYLKNILLPAFGVYAGRISDNAGQTYSAIANIGVKPTVSQDNIPILEIHIPDFTGDLYGQKLHFAFDKRIRPERKFASLDDLRIQITQDITMMKCM